MTKEIYIAYSLGLNTSLGMYNEINIGSLKDIFKFLKRKEIFRKSRSEPPLKLLRESYEFTSKLLFDKARFEKLFKEFKKDFKRKKINLKSLTTMEYQEIEIDKNTEFVEFPKHIIPIIVLKENLLPEFVHIIHTLHVDVFKFLISKLKSFASQISDYKIEKLEIDKYKKEIILGIEIGLEPYFALGLLYVSKYEENESKREEYYSKYCELVNEVSVEVNKVFTGELIKIRELSSEELLDITQTIAEIREG